MDEYKFLSGNDRYPKGYGTERAERIPLSLEDEIHFNTPVDYSLFIPDSLPERFTAKEYAKKTKIKISVADAGLLMLTELGAVERVGMEGRSYIYERR